MSSKDKKTNKDIAVLIMQLFADLSSKAVLAKIEWQIELVASIY